MPTRMPSESILSDANGAAASTAPDNGFAVESMFLESLFAGYKSEPEKLLLSIQLAPIR